MKWLAFAFNNEQLKALVMPPAQLLLYQTAAAAASAAAFPYYALSRLCRGIKTAKLGIALRSLMLMPK